MQALKQKQGLNTVMRTWAFSVEDSGTHLPVFEPYTYLAVSSGTDYFNFSVTQFPEMVNSDIYLIAFWGLSEFNISKTE